MSILLNQNIFEVSFSRAFDQVKGMAILLVVLGHIASPYSHFIYSFHVPLFFFLGGMYVNTKQTFQTYFFKNTKRLILPYIVFGMVGMVVNYVKNIALHRPNSSVTDSLMGLFYWMDISALDHYGFVLWFLPTLFIARMLCFLSVKMIGKYGPIFVMIGSIICGSTLTLPNYPFALDQALIALPWVSAAVVCHRNKAELMNSKLFILVVLLVFSASIIYGVTPLDLAVNQNGNLLFTLPYTLSVSLGLLWIFTRLQNTFVDNGLKFFGALGVYTLLILVVHPYTNNISHLMVNYFYVQGGWLLKLILTLMMIWFFILLKARSKHNYIMKLL